MKSLPIIIPSYFFLSSSSTTTILSLSKMALSPKREWVWMRGVLSHRNVASFQTDAIAFATRTADGGGAEVPKWSFEFVSCTACETRSSETPFWKEDG